MRKYRTFAAALVAAAVTMSAAGASAQTTASADPRTAAPSETVSVTGRGSVELAPDRAVFTVGVETSNPSFATALRENNERIARVVSALRKAGAADRALRTSGFNVSPQFDYREGQQPRIIGYQVSNQITVTHDEMHRIGDLLDAALSAGGNVASGLQLTVSDPAKGREQGLKLAFENARLKAQALAQAAGRTLGRALAITEGAAPSLPRPYGMEMMKMTAADSAQVPIEPGVEDLAFTVSVVFELR